MTTSREIADGGGTSDTNGMTLSNVRRRVDSGWTVWSVENPNQLTAVAGYLRFNAHHGYAFYRGESALRSTMLASAFRPHSDGSGHKGLTRLQFDGHAAAMRTYVDQLFGGPCACAGGPFSFSKAHRCSEVASRASHSSAALVSGTYRAVVEPLLQHYGIKTRWLDVVDNIWVALWFACFRQVSVGRYSHHVRRSVSSEGMSAKAYVIIFQTEPLVETGVPGYRVGQRTRAVDLRYSVPSVYLRPHAQHGALLAPAVVGGEPLGSLHESVAGVIEVGLNDALDWLGSGSMTSAGTLFPSASFDDGYRRLLDYAPEPPPKMGNLTIFGPLV